MMRIAVTAVLFAATWLLWSGLYLPTVLALGVVSCLLVTLLAVRIGFFDEQVYTLHLAPKLPGYWLWMVKEIVKANFEVARIIFSPRLPIKPCIVSVDASDLPSVTQATLANSITLTPGTLTLDIDRGYIEVHCLTETLANELSGGELLRRARKLAGG